MKLNIGSGGKVIPGWAGVDIRPMKYATIYTCPAWDLPLENNVVEAIYSRHMIEHLTREEAIRALVEWRRVLQPGGTLEISCPDLDYCLKILQDPNAKNDLVPNMTNRQVAMGGLYGWQSHAHDVHKWGWREEDLHTLLVSLEFQDVHHARKEEALEPDLFRAEADVHLKARK